MRYKRNSLTTGKAFILMAEELTQWEVDALSFLGTCSGTVSLHRLSLLSAGCLLVTGLSIVPLGKVIFYI